VAPHNEGMAGEWDSNGAKKHCTIYQEMFYFFNGMTDYIDILDSIGNMFGDGMILFISQYDNAPVHRTRNVKTWLDEHDVEDDPVASSVT